MRRPDRSGRRSPLGSDGRAGNALIAAWTREGAFYRRDYIYPLLTYRKITIMFACTQNGTPGCEISPERDQI